MPKTIRLYTCNVYVVLKLSLYCNFAISYKAKNNGAVLEIEITCTIWGDMRKNNAI